MSEWSDDSQVVKREYSGDLTIGGDDYLAIVERQRAEALATIERVKGVVHPLGILYAALPSGLYANRCKTILDSLRAALDHDALATVRGQADAEMEEGT